MQSFSAIIEDHTHYSAVMRGNRNYRVFLPPDYFISGKRYPVLYWFHGSGGSSKQDTYKADFEAYIDNHDLIIVNVDGTTPSRTTWDYSLAFEFDKRTQEGKAANTGMHFSKYIRELIGVIDSQYRTIADRDHRAVSGQSMGGLMSPWIASQNKDMFGSASLFSPSPDAGMFGPSTRRYVSPIVSSTAVSKVFLCVLLMPGVTVTVNIILTRKEYGMLRVFLLNFMRQITLITELLIFRLNSTSIWPNLKNLTLSQKLGPC